MTWLLDFLSVLLATVRDVVPIAVVIFGFQLLVLRKPIPNMRRVLTGFAYVIVGLALFLQGLEQALFPIGRLMAEQLTSIDFIAAGDALRTIDWDDYYWVYLFAFAIGFSTTIAEPSLLAVALKAHEVSGGAIGAWGLRLAVSLGVAIGISSRLQRSPCRWLRPWAWALLRTFPAEAPC